MGKKSGSYKYLTEVSHVVQVRAEGPKAPEAARPERAEAKPYNPWTSWD